MRPKLTIDEYGIKIWRLPNGDYHREDGPAIEYVNGSRHWYIDGKCHREDGPAIEYSGGDKSWYLNGENYTKIKYNQKMRSIKLKLLLK
jgi:hypothetical protein